MEPSIIVAAVGVTGGIIGSVATALIVALFGRKREKAASTKTEADANEQVRATVMLLLEPLRTRITELECKTALQEKKIAAQEMEIADLKSWSESLVKQVIDLGGQPVPMRPTYIEPVTQSRKRKLDTEE